MGDRCYMTVRCKPGDVEMLKGELFENDEGIGIDGIAQLSCSEANYAYGVGGGDFGELPTGIPFYGWHANGDQYNPGQFATDGNRMYYVNGDCDNRYEIGFDPDTGEPIQSDVDDVKQFISFKHKVKEMITRMEEL